jgi:iron complex outermembrane receptor protein
MNRTDVCIRVLTIAATLVGLAGGPLAAQQEGADSVPRFMMDSVVVSIMVTPVRVGVSPYPISVAGAAELREGKTGMFLEDALETLPGVQVQNRFNYAVGERVSIRGFGSTHPASSYDFGRCSRLSISDHCA